MSLVSFGYRLRFWRELRATKNFIEGVKKEVSSSGKSVFVFANGPSLSDIDLVKINELCKSGKFDLIAINSFLSKSASVVKPRFAVFADNVHFSGGDNQYTSDVKMCEALDVSYFVPAKYAKDNSKKRIGYCSICDIDAANVDDVTKPVGYYGVTAFFAITIAKMIGYKNIYLCGFDNSYFKDFLVKKDGKMAVSHRHYYDRRDDLVEIACSYASTSEFFFDVYRHFLFLEKIISKSDNVFNIAKTTYVATVPRDFSLDVYRDSVDHDESLK